MRLWSGIGRHIVLALGVVSLAAWLVSQTWGQATAYDDGGIGSGALLVLMTIGQPFVQLEQLIDGRLGRLGSQALVIVVCTAFYLGLDWIVVRLLRARAARAP